MFQNKVFYKESKLQPSPSVFTAVWAIIYALIGVSGIIIYKEDRNLFYLWLLQLVLNLSWVPLLFFIKNLLFSFVHILLLLILIVIMWYYMQGTVKVMWAPYVIWVSIATIIMLDTVVINAD